MDCSQGMPICRWINKEIRPHSFINIWLEIDIAM